MSHWTDFLFSTNPIWHSFWNFISFVFLRLQPIYGLLIKFSCWLWYPDSPFIFHSYSFIIKHVSCHRHKEKGEVSAVTTPVTCCQWSALRTQWVESYLVTCPTSHGWIVSGYTMCASHSVVSVSVRNTFNYCIETYCIRLQVYIRYHITPYVSSTFW